MTGTTTEQLTLTLTHEKKGTGTHLTGKHQWRKKKTATTKTTKLRERGGRGRKCQKEPPGLKKKPARRETEHANESHDRCSELLGMHMPKDR